MNVSPYYEQAIRSYSAEDKAFYDRATGMLPVRKETTPYHSGPHSVRSLRMAYELAGRPANVLEIGFCIGYSAALWLELGKAYSSHISTLDISARDQTIEAAGILDKIHGKRIDVYLGKDSLRPTEELNKRKFGLVFIDADHSVEGVDSDTAWALELKIPYILFDDFYHWGPGTQPAIEKYNLVPLAILGTMCLCRPAYE